MTVPKMLVPMWIHSPNQQPAYYAQGTTAGQGLALRISAPIPKIRRD